MEVLKMKKTLALSMMLILMFAVVLSACGKAKDDSAASAAPANAFKVGMVTDIGGVNDNSFNQSAWEGLQKFGCKPTSKNSP